MKAPMPLALAALSISTAQAAEPNGTLTLACQGTVTGTGTEEKPELISMGVIVNLHGNPQCSLAHFPPSALQVDVRRKCEAVHTCRCVQVRVWSTGGEIREQLNGRV